MAKPILWKQHFEALIVGTALIAIGTAVASSVAAQGKTAAKSASTNTTAISPKVTETACEPAKSPDAMCTLPLTEGAETKVCFGVQHPRCFELKSHKLLQMIRGQLAQVTELDASSESAAKAKISEYSSYLSSKLGAKPNKYFSCMNAVSIESKSERKEFCLSALTKKELKKELKKEVDAKTMALIAALEAPKQVKK